MSSFQNRIGVRGDLNRGGKGLFTDAQTEERLKVHAIAMANGNHPTIREICEHWKETFGIVIAEQSEREWRANNVDRIRRKRIELVSIGEIDVPIVSNKEIADNVQTLLLDIGKHRTALKNSTLYQKQRLESLCEKSKFETIGITADEYFHAPKELKDKYDFELQNLKERKNEITQLYKLFDESLNQKEDKAVKMLDMLVKQAIRLNSDEAREYEKSGALPKKRADLPKAEVEDVEIDVTDEMRQSLG